MLAFRYLCFLEADHELPPFAMWTAFPSSDYYEGSAPRVAHLAVKGPLASPRGVPVFGIPDSINLT